MEPILFNSLSQAVATLTLEHQASGFVPHRYINNHRKYKFADYLHEYLEEVCDSILNVREDIFMRKESSLVRHALESLTLIDYQLIKFFHGSAMIAVTFASIQFPEPGRHLNAIFEAKSELDLYLANRERTTLDSLLVKADLILKSSDVSAMKGLSKVYDELWLDYIVG